ncbi:polysaccharide pyruvyl transferase family protein [Shewanella sp. 10N.7]|uniref:polysaccharide pyruvyl transferase family protein n=1 Tax=Shewanella sp. 10N.7 TaxID=2885093 RepID=UPI001E423ED8|nr:polysaccharide pyruvyl transferase family protein [Shewanella sp. 10N.7]MCC4833075.1 polysaccharide pyruvyl transferase family protein [Shewanella sp. 10N.7]
MDSTVFFRPITQYENLGDLVINQELLKALPVNSSVVIEAKGVPTWFVEALIKDIKIEQVLTEKKPFYKRVIKSIFSRKQTYFLDVPGHVFYEIADRSGWFRFIKMRLFSLLGIRYVRLGVSLGPYGDSALALEVQKSRAYFYTGVREKYSHQYLKSVGINKFEYFPDFGLCLDYSSGDKTEKCGVGFSFRSGVVSSNANNAENTLAICDALNTIKQSYQLTPIVQVNLDDDYMSLLANEIELDTASITFFDHDADKIFSAYENVKFVISNRLHVLIFALSRGAMVIPYIDRSRHTKVTGVFEDIGLGDVIYDIANPTDINEHLQLVESIFSGLCVESIFKDKKQKITKILSESVFKTD